MDWSLGPAAGGRWRGLLLAVTIFAAVSVPFLLVARATTLWDRDEPRFAGAALEMLASGDLLVPTFNGEPRLQKPPLVYWLMTLSLRLLGPTELAVRLWSVLAAGLAAAFTFLAGRRLAGERAGLAAAGILATSPLFLLEGVAATTDALLLASITGALAVVVAGRQDGFTTGRVIALALALGVAQLAKGPVGLAIPLLVVALAAGASPARREEARRLAGPVLVAACAGFALFALWLIPANRASGGQLLEAGLRHEILDRMVRPMEGHGGRFLLALPYYVPVVLVGLGPWVLQLPLAFGRLLEGRTAPASTSRLLLAWSVGPFVFFSLVATKLPHYVLPVFPALALAVGTLAVGPNDGPESGRDGRSERILAWLGTVLFCLVALGLLAALVAGMILEPIPGTRAPLGLLAVLLLAAAPAGIRLHLAGRHRAAAGLLVGAAALMEVVGCLWLLPRAEALKPVPRLAETIRSRTAAGVHVVCHGFEEPSLVFYVRRAPVRVLPDAAAVAEWAAERKPGVLVTTRERLVAVERVWGRLPLWPLAAGSGINVSNGEWIELVALERLP